MAWALAATAKAIFKFVDRAGRNSHMGIFVDSAEDDPASGAPEALRLALQATSDAAIKEVALQSYALNDSAETPETDAFDRPTDKCKLVFIDDENGNTTIQIPSFLAANYQTDGVTPLTSGAPQAVVDYILAECVSADGISLSLLGHARRMVPQGLKSWTRK